MNGRTSEIRVKESDVARHLKADPSPSHLPVSTSHFSPRELLEASRAIPAVEQRLLGLSDLRVPADSRISTLAGPVRLGHSVVEANGFNNDGRPIYVVQNFIPSIRGKAGLPLQIDAEPDDNKSANMLAIPCLGAGEVALTTTPTPGVVEYYVERGLLDSVDQVRSFNGNLEGGRHLGFPHFDPVSLAATQQSALEPGYFVSAFTSEYVRSQARDLGLEPVQRSDSYFTNDKVGFVQAASRHGFRVSPHVVLKDGSDILRACDRFRNSNVWVKFSHAFGGDLLFQVKAPLSIDKMSDALDKIRATIGRAVENNQYGAHTLETIWPSGSRLPAFFGIVVEEDARNISGPGGQVVSTGSNLMEIRQDGTTVVQGCFEQIVGPMGDFWGSRSIPADRFEPAVTRDLHDQFQAIGRYAAKELSLFGLVGVDFMVIETPGGEQVPVMIELNGRPPISACSHIVGSQKLEAKEWISRYMWAPDPILSAGQFEQLVTVDGHNFARQGADEGAVIPMYLSSVFHRSQSGAYQPLIEKRWGQILIAGESQEHCEDICRLLSEKRGISYTRPYQNIW